MANLPFKIYEVGNLASVPANVFVGKTFISDNGSNQKTKENCFSTFLFASVVGGKNIRIDQATESEPYLFVDAKFFDFKPFNYYIDYLGGVDIETLEEKYDPSKIEEFDDTIIESVQENENGDLAFMVKSLGTDGELTIMDNGSELVLRAGVYKAKNIDFPEKVPLYTHSSKDVNGNNIFHINKLIEGQGISFEQILEFEWDAVVALFSSSSSLSSLSSVSSDSDTSSLSSSSRSESSDSSLSSLSSLSSKSEECCITCCSDCEIFDVEFEVSESGGQFIDFVEAWETFDRYAWGASSTGHGTAGSLQYKVTADQHLNGGSTFRAPAAYTPRTASFDSSNDSLAAAWIVQNFPGKGLPYVSRFGNEQNNANNPVYVDGTQVGYSQTFNYQNNTQGDGWTYFHVDGAFGFSLRTAGSSDSIIEVYRNSNFTGLIGTYDFSGIPPSETEDIKIDFVNDSSYFMRVAHFSTYQTGATAPNDVFTISIEEEATPNVQAQFKTDLNPTQYTSLISPTDVTFDEYRFSLVLSASENDYDNDLISFVLATWEDPGDMVSDPYTGQIHPRLHTLSAIRQFTTQSFGSYGSDNIQAVWAIILDLNQSTEEIIAFDNTPNTGLGPSGDTPWNDFPSGTRIEVERKGSVFTARCTDLADNPDNPASLGYKLIVDVSNGDVTTFASGIETTVTSPYAAQLSPFNIKSRVGFGALSNEFSTFTLNSCDVTIEAEFDDECALCEPNPREVAEDRVTAVATISCVSEADDRAGIVRFPENVFTPALNDEGDEIAYFKYISTDAIDDQNAIVRYRLFQIFDAAEGTEVTGFDYFKYPETTSHELTINSNDYNLPNGITTSVDSEDLPDDCVAPTFKETAKDTWTSYLEGVLSFTLEMDRSGIGGDTDTYNFADSSVFVFDNTFNIDKNNRKILFKVVDPEQGGKQVGAITFVVTDCVATNVTSEFGDLLVYERSCNCGPLFGDVDSLSSESSSSESSGSSQQSSTSSSSCAEQLDGLLPDSMPATIDVSGTEYALSGSSFMIPPGVDRFTIEIPQVTDDGIVYDPYELFLQCNPFESVGSEVVSGTSSSSSSEPCAGVDEVIQINEHTWEIRLGECISQTLYFAWSLLKKGNCTGGASIAFEDDIFIGPEIEIDCPSSSSSTSESSASSSSDSSDSSNSSNSSQSDSSQSDSSNSSVSQSSQSDSSVSDSSDSSDSQSSLSSVSSFSADGSESSSSSLSSPSSASSASSLSSVSSFSADGSESSSSNSSSSESSQSSNSSKSSLSESSGSSESNSSQSNSSNSSNSSISGAESESSQSDQSSQSDATWSGTLTVEYGWIGDDLDTQVEFLGESDGWACAGGTTYLIFYGDNTGVDQPVGSGENYDVLAGDALFYGAWSGSTDISLYACWYEGASGGSSATARISTGTDTLNIDVTPSPSETNGSCCNVLQATIRLYDDGTLEVI